MNNKKSFLLGISLFYFLLTGCVTTGLHDVRRSLSNTPWGYKKVSAPHPVYLGDESQRFEVRPGDCGSSSRWSDCESDRERSEVSSKRARFFPGTDKWISYMLYLPSDFKSSRFVKSTLGQIHMEGGFKGTAGGFKSFPPLLQINVKDYDYIACFHVLYGDENSISDRCENRHISSIEEMKGRWSRITIHLFGEYKKPKLDIFFNGNKVAEFEQSLPRDPEYYYLKYGIYRSFVSRHGGPLPIQIVYYDEVKIGSNREEVEKESEIID